MNFPNYLINAIYETLLFLKFLNCEIASAMQQQPPHSSIDESQMVILNTTTKLFLVSFIEVKKN
jgi:hypothetical protein